MNPVSFAEITLQDVTTYLGAKGWRRREAFPRSELIVFDGPEDDGGEAIQAVIPAGTAYKDFYVRLSELLGTLAVIENRSPDEIASDMLLPRADRLQVRLFSDFATAGSIPLRYAPKLVNGLRELVIAAACAERFPKPYFWKATKIDGDYAEHCRFAQTQRGSFIVNIECPAGWVPEKESMSDIPFGRRVTTRIMQGLSDLSTAVLHGRVDGLLDKYTDGLNANMCEALKELQPSQTEPKFEFEMNWARNVLTAPNLPVKVQLERRSFEFLETLSEKLRAQAEQEARELLGSIVKLSLSEAAGTDKPTLTIRLAEMADGVQQATLMVDPQTYRTACDAHRDSKSVRVFGRLTREGRHWRIIDARDFAVIDTSSSGQGTGT